LNGILISARRNCFEQFCRIVKSVSTIVREEENEKEIAVAAKKLGHKPGDACEGIGEEIFTRPGKRKSQERVG
jgi:hypothetical protein